MFLLFRVTVASTMIQFFKLSQTIIIKGWFVVEAEQDPDKANPLEYAKKARTFIREHTGI